MQRLRFLIVLAQLWAFHAGNAQTCWTHEQSEANDRTPVAPESVRVSTRYRAAVMPDLPDGAKKESFVYMSIPRNGMPAANDRPDGAEFVAAARLTMSWTTFLYRDDVWLEIKRVDEGDAGDFTIRPRTLDFETRVIDRETLEIRIPYRDTGYRFSIEFTDDLVTSYNDLSGISGELSEDSTGREIHTEPRNALLVFAEPEKDLVEPTPSDGEIFYPETGMIDRLHEASADIIYFRPGVYWMPATYHAYLHERVRRVHLAPGAYVKGALEFRGAQGDYQITGAGVLSGEQYVYEPDRRNAYAARRAEDGGDCTGTCIKMIQFYSKPTPQRANIKGITVANPPYHAFVVYGDEQSFPVHFDRYKQVGAWYWQTDGVELYRGEIGRAHV